MKTDLLTQIRLCDLPLPQTEYRFHDKRKWRFDYAWPVQMVALEIEGGTFLPGGGRHNRPRGFRQDIDKYNAAALLGWTVLRCTPTMVNNGEALTLIKRAINVLGSRLE